MATFFIFGKYSRESAEGISAQRTAKVHRVIQEMGGKVKGIYALLGEHDVVLIVELPRMADAMRVSVALKRLTDIAFFTVPAMPVEEFDQLVGEM